MAQIGAARSRPSSDQMRPQLLKQAAAVFAETGYGGAGLRQIGQRAGVTAAALYNHFDGKEDLLRAVIVNASDALSAVLLSEMSRGDAPEDRLSRMLRAHMRFTLQRPAETTVILEQAHLLPPANYAVVREKQMSIFNLYRACIRELLERRGAGRMDADLAAFNVLAIVNGLPRWFRPGRRLAMDAVLDQTVAFALNAVLCEAPS